MSDTWNVVIGLPRFTRSGRFRNWLLRRFLRWAWARGVDLGYTVHCLRCGSIRQYPTQEMAQAAIRSCGCFGS